MNRRAVLQSVAVMGGVMGAGCSLDPLGSYTGSTSGITIRNQTTEPVTVDLTIKTGDVEGEIEDGEVVLERNIALPAGETKHESTDTFTGDYYMATAVYAVGDDLSGETHTGTVEGRPSRCGNIMGFRQKREYDEDGLLDYDEWKEIPPIVFNKGSTSCD